jgi:hypothetical protein
MLVSLLVGMLILGLVLPLVSFIMLGEIISLRDPYVSMGK